MSRVVPHLSETGGVSCHSSDSLEGGCPSSAEVIENTEVFIQLYSLFSAVDRFTYLRDFSNHVCLIDFFYLNLRDFVN